jgi:glycosyl transferase family 2
MCLTFARPKRILEAVHSFLGQNYTGEKELVILNDFDKQAIRLEHPEVTVINLSRRFRTLGEKRNAAAALCRHDLLAVWDDDDIYLFLFGQVIGRSKNYDHIKPSEIFYLYRWQGTQSYHLSGFGLDSAFNSGYEKILEYVLYQLQTERLKRVKSYWSRNGAPITPKWLINTSLTWRSMIAALHCSPLICSSVVKIAEAA